MIRNVVANTNTENGKEYQHEVVDIDRIGTQGMTCLRYQVNSFWSRDPITIYISRDVFADTSVWKTEISWSSGGRDTSTVKSSSEAAKNFALALTDAAAMSDMLEGMSEQFEDRYKIYREECERERLQLEAAKQALIDADPEMGEAGAVELLDQVKTIVNENMSVMFTVKNRGNDHFSHFLVKKPMSKARFYKKHYGDYVSVSAKELVDTIKIMSATYTIG